MPSPPILTHASPEAALPGGEIDLYGANLLPAGSPASLPTAAIGDRTAPLSLARPSRLTLRIPDGAVSAQAVVHCGGQRSNSLPLRIATPVADNLHPVGNPAVDAGGNLYATFSGTRGQQVPVCVFRIDASFRSQPFLRDLLNPTGLAMGPDGLLYVSSRADGVVYRIARDGTPSPYAEGLGIATGIAFDREGNLFVGDRSGTIFKIARPAATPLSSLRTSGAAEEEAGTAPPGPSIFVFATLEPSIAAYHLAFNSAGTLFVSGPTTSSNQSIHAIDRDGNATVFYSGLGRAQGLAFDTEDNLYIAASLHGARGIVRITPGPHPVASLALSGNNLVGLAFLQNGGTALATRDGLFYVDLGIRGRALP